MSTGLMNNQNTHIKSLNRFAEIAKLNEVVFHVDDLANLWKITNKNTLYTTLKRYVQKGLLYRIYKGFYSIKDPRNIDPFLLGTKALHGNSYVSTETILANGGVIQQNISAITMISEISKKFKVLNHSFISRQLDEKFRYQTAGISTKNGVRVASINRAIADLLYFNPHAHLDGEKFINWQEVKELQEEIGYPLTRNRYV